MYYSRPRPIPQKNEYIDRFLGYNANVRTRDGEFEDMENLTSDYAPVLSPRNPRQIYAQGTAPSALAVKGLYRQQDGDTALCWLDGKDLHVGDAVYKMPGLTDGEKQIVIINSFVAVFPDGIYVNPNQPLAPPAYLSASTTATNAKFDMCDLDGSNYSIKFTQDTAPEAPGDGDYWVDTSGSPHSLRQFSKALGVWTFIPTVYVKISAPGIGADFQDQDGVRLRITTGGNQQLEDLDGYNVIWAKTRDYIVVVGILDAAVTADVSVYRELPNMDFVFECNNRLWGCKYGDRLDTRNTTNRIYCSARGDPTNWHRFSVSADDSYFADIGADGRFTGACAFRGKPYFFKENAIISVHGINPPFSVQTTQAKGVQYGCGKSIAVANERMYYKSRLGVCVFDGSVPRDIGYAFGETQYEAAVGAAFGDKYYVSMKQGEDYSLFVYDGEQRVWHREDAFHAVDMIRGTYHLYAIDADTNRIVTLEGDEDSTLTYAEDDVSWSAVTGEMGLSDSRQKYISQIVVRMEIDQGSQVNVFIRYDRRKEWIPVGVERGNRLNSFNMAIRPERCDHLQLKFSGFGPCKIYSIMKKIQKGSDHT